MNLNDLKIFIATAECETFTKAAAVTNTVQSNVSARIKSLEDSLNLKLFIRNTRSVELTENGAMFLKLAKEISTSIDNFKITVAKQVPQTQGLIKIGCIQTTAALRAPGIFRNFTNEYPDVDFRLKTGNTTDLVKEVLRYKLDGAFVSGNIEHPDLDICPIVAEELCVVYSSAFTDFKKMLKSPKQLKVVVFSKGCTYRELLLQLLAEKGISDVKTYEMDTLEGIINTVEAGSGITLLPTELIKKQYSYRNLSTWTIPDKRARIQTVFIKRKDFPMSEVYGLFFNSIRKSYNATQIDNH